MQSLPQMITTLVIPTGAIPGQPMIVIDGTSDAIKVYNASGQLVASMAASAGADSSGQQYAEGIQVGANTDTQVIMDPGSKGIFFAPNDGFSALLTALQSFPCVSNNQTEFAQLTGPSVSASQYQHVSVGLQSSSPDGTSMPVARGYLQATDASDNGVTVLFWDSTGTTVTGQLYAAAPNLTPIVQESWHSLTPKNSWTNLSGYTPFQYRAIGSPPKSVQVVGNLVPGTITAGTVLGTLPTGYLPTKQQYDCAYTDVTSASAGVHIDTSGNLKVFGVSSGATVLGINSIFPLDV